MDAEVVSRAAILLAFGMDDQWTDQFEILAREESIDDFENDSADRICISGFLEHLCDEQAAKFIAKCKERLKPGRHIDVAVPDFLATCERYSKTGYIPQQKGKAVKSFYDLQKLFRILSDAGFYQLGQLDGSNGTIAVRGAKPSHVGRAFSLVVAVLSAPRFGPVMHWQHSGAALTNLQIPYKIAVGAYWHQVFTEAIDSCLDSAEIIITCDYDSIFSQQDIEEMLRLLSVYPHVDAIAPLQYRRNMREILGVPSVEIKRSDMGGDLIPMKSAHFGATCFRAEALKRMEKPWFLGIPNQQGGWGPGHTDADIYFWKQWNKAGNKLCCAPGVRVGHIVEAIVWPGDDFEPIFQMPSELHRDGPPVGAYRSHVINE